MKRMLVAGCVATCAAGLLAVGVGASRDRLVVHEWGTFLAMNGADGVTLDGMYHEEHALPGFVHARSRDELRLRTSNLKGETPVIYFYADSPLGFKWRWDSLRGCGRSGTRRRSSWDRRSSSSDRCRAHATAASAGRFR